MQIYLICNVFQINFQSFVIAHRGINIHIVDFVPSLVNPLDSPARDAGKILRSFYIVLAGVDSISRWQEQKCNKFGRGGASRFDVYPLRDKTYRMGETFRWRGKKKREFVIGTPQRDDNVFPTCFYLIKSSVDTSRSVSYFSRYDREITHTCACVYVCVCVYTGWSVIHGDSVSSRCRWIYGGGGRNFYGLERFKARIRNKEIRFEGFRGFRVWTFFKSEINQFSDGRLFCLRI